MADELTALPTGTVTFLFTDIERSTGLLREHPQVYAATLEEHRQLIRAAVAAHGGREVDTQGDSFFLAFPTAAAGLAAAAGAQRSLAAQPWPDGVRVLVRMGLHSGEATIAGGGYVGLAVHRAARIAAAAHGGQVLLSETTAALAREGLPSGTALRGLGEHRLRDFTQPVRLYQLDIAGLPSRFPPLRTPVRSQPLPVPSGGLLGRDTDVAALAALLTDARTRLVTVTGAGGIGKTRIAVETARRVADAFPGGVAYVPLGALADPRLVLSTVADAVGARGERSGELLDALREALADERTLVLLDNFEQVADAAGEVARLLDAVPATVVLVTSRRVLHLRSEQQYPLAPLTELPAEQLFAERAAAVRPGFLLDEENSPVIGEICRRLDGLPLAIELAAARVRLLPPAELLARLRQRLDVIGTGPVDLPERQRTLRATTDWSFELLRPHEQAVFTRLGVFSGGCTPAAAEVVCGRPGEPEVLDALAALLDASLLVQSDGSGVEARLSMLDTVWVYAAERLAASPDRSETERRHTRWVLTGPLLYTEPWGQSAPLVDVETLTAVPGRSEGEHAVWAPADPLAGAGANGFSRALERFDVERPNVRGAVQRAVDSGDVATAALLIRNALAYVTRRDGWREILDWLTRVLPGAGAAPPAVRGRLLVLRAVAAGFAGDVAPLRPLLEEARPLLPDDAEHAYDRVLAGLAGIFAAMSEGSLEEAGRCIEDTAARGAAMGQDLVVAIMARFRGSIALFRGDLDAAEADYRDAQELAGRVGDEALVGQVLSERGLVLLTRGDVVGARRLILDAAAANRRTGFQASVADSLEGLAAVATAVGLPVVATRALAAAAAAREDVTVARFPALAPLVDGLAVRAREQLGDEAYGRAWAEGRAWSLSQALDRTLEDLTDVDVASGERADL